MVTVFDWMPPDVATTGWLPGANPEGTVTAI
jgi:hypothetical protein